jgi:hypothetical protein
MGVGTVMRERVAVRREGPIRNRRVKMGGVREVSSTTFYILYKLEHPGRSVNIFTKKEAVFYTIKKYSVGKLTEMKSEIDGCRILHPFQHRLTLPPRPVILVIEVCHVLRGMVRFWLAIIADVARLAGADRPGLKTEFRFFRYSTSVGSVYRQPKGCIHKLWHAPLRSSVVIVATTPSPWGIVLSTSHKSEETKAQN